MSNPKITVSRIVIFHGGPAHEFNGTQEHPAIVTRVWSEDCVNLTVFPDGGPPFNASSVTPADSGAVPGWSWPPRV